MLDIAGKRKHSIDEHIHIKEIGNVDKILIKGNLAIAQPDADEDYIDHLSHLCPVCNRNMLAIGHLTSFRTKSYKNSYNAFEYCEFRCPSCGSLLYTDPFIADPCAPVENFWKDPEDFWFFDTASEMDKYITDVRGDFTLGEKTWPIFVIPIFAIIGIAIAHAIRGQIDPSSINPTWTILSMLICGAISLVYYFVMIRINNRRYQLPSKMDKNKKG